MDSRWFQEDRKDKTGAERQQAIKESEKVLRNSTIIRERLKAILEDEFDKSIRTEEDFDNPNWERLVISQIARRKTLREIIKLIDF